VLLLLDVLLDRSIRGPVSYLFGTAEPVLRVPGAPFG
jgi:hypothetical protein